MARSTCLAVIGTIIALIGVGILIVGVYVTPKELPGVFREQVDKYVVVDSEDSEAYKGWAGQNDIDNPYYLVVYMFNLTNVDQVLQGAVPAYQQVGPYMYRRYRQSQNVTFLDDGNLIQYNDFQNYQFDQNQSGTLSENDMFTNINPVVIGGLMQAAALSGSTGNTGEAGLIMAATAGMIKSFTDYFTGPFISLFTAYQFASYFTPIMNANIAAFNASSQQQGYAMFIDTWRNGTTEPAVGNWNGMLLNGNTPANISVYSAQLLLNASVPLSLLDPSPQSVWNWDQSVNDENISYMLMSAFQITAEQISILWNWRNSLFAPARMYPVVMSNFNLTDIHEIGWVQWANEGALNGSISMFPDIETIGFNTSIELNSHSYNWTQWRTIMDPSTGLENVTSIQAFLQYYQANPFGGNYTQWGLNANGASDLGLYVLSLALSQGIYAINANMGPTGGLFVTRSVNQWTFYCDDYLLNLIRETPPVCSFRVNNTAKPANTIYSGKSDIGLINNYKLWEQQATVDFWQTPMNVTAFTELGQFEPNHINHEPYPVFQQDTGRIIYLNYTSNVTVNGVNADRYILDFQRTFGVSEYFAQPFNGLANLTNVQFGSPIFVSLWDMLYVDPSIANVTGLTPTNEWDDNTLIDIEPVTGITVQCRRRMQVNVYVPPNNTAWFVGTGITPSTSQFGNTNFTSGIAYPLAKIGEYATVSESSAKKLNGQLALSPRVRHITFYIGVIVGPLLIVSGVCLIFVARRKHHRHRSERERLINH